MRRRAHLALLRIYRRLPRRARRFVIRRAAPTFTVGAMCVIERADGAVLLVRQSYRDRWGLPGGLLARGEAPADTARREAGEEIGLAVEVLGEPSVLVDTRVRRVDIVFRCRPCEPGPHDGVESHSAEILEARWFAPGLLPELQREAAGALATSRPDRTSG